MDFPDAKPDNTRWVILGLLWVAFLINNVDRQVVFSIFPILRQQLHFSRVQLGLVGSIFIWVYCASNPLLGRMADLIQRERLIAASLVLWSVATLGTALSYSVKSFLAWRGALGLAESLYVPATLGLIAVWHSGATRSTALAIHSSAQSVGLALGGWVGGLAAETVGWRQGFSALALIGILYAAAMAALFPRRPVPVIEKKTTRIASPFDVFKSNCFLALLFAYTTFSAMLYIFFYWLPEFVFTKYHLSLTESGLAATAYLQGASAVGVLAWGFLADYVAKRVRAGRYYLIALALVACAPFAFMILHVNSLAVMKVACVSFGFFAGGLSSNLVAAAYDVIAESNYGLTSGLINLSGGLGGGTGVLLVGWISDPYGALRIIKWVAFAVVTGALVVTVVAAKRYDFERKLTTDS